MGNIAKIYQKLIGAGLIVIASTFSSTARSATIDEEVRANRTTVVYRYIQFNGDTCGTMVLPRLKVR